MPEPIELELTPQARAVAIDGMVDELVALAACVEASAAALDRFQQQCGANAGAWARAASYMLGDFNHQLKAIAAAKPAAD